METLREDYDYVAMKVGLQNVTLQHGNPSRNHSSSVAAKEMATLSQDQLRKLTHIYRLDFLLFGYSVPEDYHKRKPSDY